MEIAISPGEPIVLSIRVFGSSGAREMDSVLDTGASFLTIPPEDAIDMGYELAAAPKVTVATANGIIQAPSIILSRVELGEYVETNVPALCLNVLGGGVSSLLGLSLLGRFRIAIDAKRRLLTVADP